MSKLYQYLQHIESGDIFAVEVETSGGIITAAVGPVYDKEVAEENLENFEYNTPDAREDGAWVMQNLDNWKLRQDLGIA